MNILSLFDGISCGQLALQRARIKIDNYFASEIDKNAIKVTQHHFPNTIQLGDITKLDVSQLPKIDFLIGGSPCQDLSIGAKVRNGIKGNRSSLFFNYADVYADLKIKNPSLKFLLENVPMLQEDEDIITDLLEIKPIVINSNLISIQNRNRLYWTNLNIGPIQDHYLSFQNIKDKEYNYCKQFKVNRTPSRELMWGNGNGKCPNVTHKDKINCITLKQDRWNNSGLVEFEDFCRYLTTNELEVGQTLPKNYCGNIVSKRQAEALIGNAWTVDVIAHIFSHL